MEQARGRGELLSSTHAVKASRGHLAMPTRADESLAQTAIEVDPASMSLEIASTHGPLERSNSYRHQRRLRQGSVKGSLSVQMCRPSPAKEQRRAIPQQQWDEDPFQAEPEITITLLGAYFAHDSTTTYGLLPHGAFLHWVQHDSSKRPDERMALNAVLAVGSIFAGRETACFGQRCARAAMTALSGRFGWFSVPIVQTRLLLSIYELAMGNESTAWDYVGLAVRAACAMRYNDEEGCQEPAQGVDEHLRYREYGLSGEQIAECRRRSFWSAFLVDCASGLNNGAPCSISIEDIHLRFPCADDDYANSMPSHAPVFGIGFVDLRASACFQSGGFADTTWLILLSVAWMNISDPLRRTKYYEPRTYRRQYEKARAESYCCMQSWRSTLPDYMQFTEANLHHSMRNGYAGILISTHVLYHSVLMQVNRYIRHRLLPDLAPRNIRATRCHAHAILRIMCAMQSYRRKFSYQPIHQLNGLAFDDFRLGPAVLSAIDILAAGGPNAELEPIMEGVEGGLEYLHGLSLVWRQTVDVRRVAELRVMQLRSVLRTVDSAARDGLWLGLRRDPGNCSVEPRLDLEHDCVYGVDTRVYCLALTRGDHDLEILGRDLAAGY